MKLGAGMTVLQEKKSNALQNAKEGGKNSTQQRGNRTGGNDVEGGMTIYRSTRGTVKGAVRGESGYILYIGDLNNTVIS